MTKRAVLLCLFMLVGATFLVAAERDAGTGYELENVHVMDKTIRLADARRYMMTFNTALGIQCRDCHDLRNFSSDDNELKLVAREMMRMTKDINETWFPEAETEVVTCFTCHQGERVPAFDEDAIGVLLPQE